MDKNASLQPVEVNELATIEGGLGRSMSGDTYTLWRDIKNNGGWVDPTPPIPTGPQRLDYHSILTSAHFPD